MLSFERLWVVGREQSMSQKLRNGMILRDGTAGSFHLFLQYHERDILRGEKESKRLC